MNPDPARAIAGSMEASSDAQREGRVTTLLLEWLFDAEYQAFALPVEVPDELSADPSNLDSVSARVVTGATRYASIEAVHHRDGLGLPFRFNFRSA